VLKTLNESYSVAVKGIVQSLATTGTMPDALIADIARSTGDENLAQKISAVHGELIASGQAALRNVAVHNPDEFETWAQTNHPELAAEAVRDMVTSRSIGKLQSLGRKFAAESNNKRVS
jgi:hypothetical protein